MDAFVAMSESEAQVMQVLWDAGAPLTSAMVIDALAKNKDWKPSTVWTFLGRLVEKGLLYTEKHGKRSLYYPAVSESEYRGAQTRQFLNTVHGGSVASFFTALSGGGDLQAQELDDLKEWFAGISRGEEE